MTVEEASETEKGTSAGDAAPAVQICIEARCGARYALDERIYTCPACGGLLDLHRDVNFDAATLKNLWRERLAASDARERGGVWRYRELLPYAAEDVPIVTLAEGNTPLYDAPRATRYCGLSAGALALKHQGCNPTGSFKDTGMTVAVTQAVRLGARTVVCASTGNTAASLAAYAARADLDCAILVPRGGISHAKLAQSLDYGAAVLELDGNFDDAMRAIRELGAEESIYVVNSINPFRIEGQKTVAAELLQQRDWVVPDHIVVPGGNLGNSAALGKGLKELFDLGLIERLPRLSVIQAEGAAPLASLLAPLFAAGGPVPARIDDVALDALAPVAHPQTLASAIKIGSPVSWRKALRAVFWTGGHVISVSEQEIADAKAVIGRDGIGCEPASATTVAGIKKLVAAGRIAPHESIVAVLTGHVLKDTDYAINYHRETLYTHDRTAGKNKEDRRLTSTYANHAARVKASGASILEYLAGRKR